MNKKLLYFIMLFTLPSIVFAKSDFTITTAIFIELFCSIHMTVFVLVPLAKIIEKDDSKVKGMVLKLFLIRVVILVILDLINPIFCMADFFAIFIGAFILIPILISKDVKGNMTKVNLNSNVTTSADAVVDNNSINEELTKRIGSKFVESTEFDSMYLMNENDLLDTYIKNELKNGGYNTKYIPYEMIKRRKVLNIIFALLLFIFIVMIFFHFPIYTYIIGAIILFIYFKVSRKFDLVKFLNKEIKSRPSDNMKNIIASVMSNCTEDNTRSLLLISSFLAIIIPMVLFINPVILYEEADGGYYVRFYAWGLKNYKTASIPEMHNGKYVVGLRGNTFSNMPFLESVDLPNSIKVMRGQTFKNDKKLKSVNLPSSLEYLGGGAFYNCTSLEGVAIPNGVSEIGGEAFYNCTSLKEVVLPSNLQEIRGNTFENCSSLTNIEIPSSVTRIGGHAFYGCSSLNSVIIKEDSKLKEIGSSAFRLCSSLYSINLPKNTYVNARAFKESPTNISFFEKSINGNQTYNMKLNFYVGYVKTFAINNYSETVNIILENIEEISKLEQKFYFKITGSVNQEFTLDNVTNSSITINDHLSLSIDYYYYNNVILDVNYN